MDMRFDAKTPPRKFAIGDPPRVQLSDCGRMHLSPDELVTFVTERGNEYDVTRKDWGFYATPSLNGRLESFSLRGVLVRNNLSGRYFLMLVERGKEPSFERYIASEQCGVVCWLELDQSLRRSPGCAEMIAPNLHCPCEGRYRELAWRYTAPPQCEIKFDLKEQVYDRAYDRCTQCGHFFGVHALDLEGLYDDEYVNATYGGPDGMRRQFERVMALPADQSDNRGRVARVLTFAVAHGLPVSRASAPSLLDVGAGLGVFPAAMKEAGWRVLALEPDTRTVQHLRNVVSVEALSADLLKLRPETVGLFDAVTFNKVLEHVEDPVKFLIAAGRFLKPAGFFYIEVPDVAAEQEGPEREEFAIEHHHVFSPASIAIMARQAEFDAVTVERLREPSTKYTLRAFLLPRATQKSRVDTTESVVEWR